MYLFHKQGNRIFSDFKVKSEVRKALKHLILYYRQSTAHRWASGSILEEICGKPEKKASKVNYAVRLPASNSQKLRKQ